MTAREAQSTLSRRTMLKKSLQVSSGVAIALAGGLVYRALQEDIFSPFDGPAYEPWESWKTDPMAFPLATIQMAILAANPHNTQPWLFRVNQHSVEVFADKGRHLGSVDPFRREMQIGLGCAIENMTLAAKAHGYDSTVIPEQGILPKKPELKGMEKVATVLFKRGIAEQSALYQSIPKRHTDRNPYEANRAIPTDLIQAFYAECRSYGCRLDIFTEGTARDSVDLLMNDATHAIVEDEEMVMDSHHWFRTSNEHVQLYRDGPNLDAAGLSPTICALAKIFPDPSPQEGHRFWEKATKESHLASAPALGLISIHERYSKSENLAVGRVWQRLHLMAAKAGISMHPMNQPIEWIDRQRQLSLPNLAEERLFSLIGDKNWEPTFCFRMGYPTRLVVPSPRRALSQSLI